MPTVLVIDDNPDVGAALQLLFSLSGIATQLALTPAQGLARLDEADLVIQDMNFSADTTSGDEGVALFQQLRARRPDLPVILLTAWTQLERAVQLVKQGAADYLAKPWDDAKLLASAYCPSVALKLLPVTYALSASSDAYCDSVLSGA